MESRYSIDTSEGLVRLQVSGELRASGLIKLMARIASDPLHRADMDAIADLRQAHGAWDYSEIQRFRDYVARIAPAQPCRWAAVVSPGTLVAAVHVLIVISEPVSDRIRMQIFEDTHSALRWVQRRDRFVPPPEPAGYVRTVP